MKIDWQDLKAKVIVGTIFLVVFGVSYLPFASLIVNGDLSWARDFWNSFSEYAAVASSISFYILITLGPLALIGWLLGRTIGENFFSNLISLVHPILAISFLVFIFTGYQDPADIGLRP